MIFTKQFFAIASQRFSPLKITCSTVFKGEHTKTSCLICDCCLVQNAQYKFQNEHQHGGQERRGPGGQYNSGRDCYLPHHLFPVSPHWLTTPSVCTQWICLTPSTTTLNVTLIVYLGTSKTTATLVFSMYRNVCIQVRWSSNLSYISWAGLMSKTWLQIG